jgi:hypothetical protein
VSATILVVDDEADVGHCFASSSGARFAMAASTWFLHALETKLSSGSRPSPARSLPLFHCFIDQRLSFSVHFLRLFDDGLRSNEKIDQCLARRERFLNLPKLCVAETGSVTNEVKEPVLQHSLPC